MTLGEPAKAVQLESPHKLSWRPLTLKTMVLVVGLIYGFFYFAVMAIIGGGARSKNNERQRGKPRGESIVFSARS